LRLLRTSPDRDYTLSLHDALPILNYQHSSICNWAIPSQDNADACLSCSLTQATPELADATHRQAWFRLETAKRRLVYTLQQLRLDRKSTRLNSSHASSSYAVLCLK